MAQRVVNWHKCAGARAQYDTKNTKVGRVLICLKPKFIKYIWYNVTKLNQGIFKNRKFRHLKYWATLMLVSFACCKSSLYVNIRVQRPP
jgi:hypothetical protein